MNEWTEIRQQQRARGSDNEDSSLPAARRGICEGSPEEEGEDREARR
jgi:hypothetical protein